MDKIICWIERQRNEDKVLAQVLKCMYLIGQKGWAHSIIATILGIFIPIFYENHKILFVMGIIGMVLDIMYAYLCNEFKDQQYIKRKFSSVILSEQSSLIKSIVIEIENNRNWKNTIFKTVSNLVCEEIYRNFKEIFNCETRVSIEYIFDKDIKTKTNPEKHVKMSGRKSNHRATVKKSVPLTNRNKYYSYRIFSKNNKGINILREEQIQNASIWYKNPDNSVEVKKYIGIAVSIYDDSEVKFILQIDFLDDNMHFGKEDTDEDVRQFIEQYLMAYINIVSLSYLLNLNNKREIPEV